MSLLLDALRKSEAQRRAGQTPGLDLGSAALPSGARSDRNHPGSRLGWLLVLLVIIAGGTGLAWWQPWSMLVRPQTVNFKERGVVPESGLGLNGAAAVSGNVQSSAPASPSSAVSSPPRIAEQRATLDTDPGPERPPIDVSVVALAESDTARPRDAVATAADPDSGSPSSAPVESGWVDREPVKPERVESEPVEQTSAAEVTPTPRDASLDGVIRAWELPQELRAEFPQLRLTVHFYASNPADRFVLIDGERRGEGDSLGNDVRIAEIRRRGLIVDFRRYRILIE